MVSSGQTQGGVQCFPPGRIQAEAAAGRAACRTETRGGRHAAAAVPELAPARARLGPITLMGPAHCCAIFWFLPSKCLPMPAAPRSMIRMGPCSGGAATTCRCCVLVLRAGQQPGTRLGSILQYLLVHPGAGVTGSLASQVFQSNYKHATPSGTATTQNIAVTTNCKPRHMATSHTMPI
jgi:hypothetical protein